jgi:hypothetical protein
MRTTLTLDDDVAAALLKIQKARKASLKTIVNEALRHGLPALTAPPAPKQPFRTTVVNHGGCLFANVDDVAEILAIAEGETYK